MCIIVGHILARNLFERVLVLDLSISYVWLAYVKDVGITFSGLVTTVAVL